MNIWVSASDGDVGALQKFVAEGGNVNIQDDYGYTPLQAAVSYNHLELVQFLLKNGASATLGDNEMDTPLHRAETVECAKILLEHGAALNARNTDGRTPYDSAIEDEHTELIAMYASIGAEKSDAIDEEEPEQWQVELPMED